MRAYINKNRMLLTVVIFKLQQQLENDELRIVTWLCSKVFEMLTSKYLRKKTFV